MIILLAFFVITSLNLLFVIYRSTVKLANRRKIKYPIKYSEVHTIRELLEFMSGIDNGYDVDFS